MKASELSHKKDYPDFPEFAEYIIWSKYKGVFNEKAGLQKRAGRSEK